MSTRVALYLRVSTDQQEVENQRLQLVAECERRGISVAAVYEEQESAWKAGHQAALHTAYQDAKRGRFTVLWTWALDRLSREGPAAMLLVVKRFAAVGVQVVSLKEDWTWTSGPTTELLLALAGWVAQMESQRRSERTRAGMQRVKASGKHVGRPLGKKDGCKRRAKRVRLTGLSEWA